MTTHTTDQPKSLSLARVPDAAPLARSSSPAQAGLAPRGIRIETYADLERFCGALARSGYFKDAKDAAQAMVKVQYGLELGIGPVVAMTSIHIVEGKPSLSAGLISSRVKASGKYDYRVITLDNSQCHLQFSEGGRVLGDSVFTIEDARGAGLAGRGVWKSYARNMLFARAMSNGARWYCSDVFSGAVYTPDEISGGALADEPEGIPADAGAPPAPVSVVVEVAPKAQGKSATVEVFSYMARLDAIKEDGALRGAVDAYGPTKALLPPKWNRIASLYEGLRYAAVTGALWSPTAHEREDMDKVLAMRMQSPMAKPVEGEVIDYDFTGKVITTDAPKLEDDLPF